MSESTNGVVSVVLVNYRGAEDTIEAISRLGEVDWPSDDLEIIVVENASGDDSLERIRAAAPPHVKLIESKQNLGFAGGCNLGVRHARGEVVAFLNNDAKPDRRWIRAAMERFGTDRRIGAVASRVLDWNGDRVDYIGSALTWFGQGYKPLTAEPLPNSEPAAVDVLFGTGSAMFVRRAAFEALGGFDERYFMFFEDVDLGWRLNLAGWRFVYEPGSIAYHKHHASMASYGAFKEQYLLERNALFTIYKNADDETLARLLPATMALTVRRAIARGDLDSNELDLRAGGPETPVREVPKSTLAGVYAIDRFVEHLPGLARDRARIQSERTVSDRAIWRLFGEMDAPSYTDERYLDGYTAIADAFDVLQEPEGTKVLIITGDPIGPRMAGPALRAWAMAEAMSTANEVTLVSLARVEPVPAPFRVVHVAPGDEKAMRPLEADADVIVFQGLAMALFDTIRRSSKVMVCDVYDPMHLEQLEQAREHGATEWSQQVASATEVLNDQLARGDFFLCASDRQRHFYLGQLAALGRVNPAVYRDDPDLERLIAVVPFGLSADLPPHDSQVLKGVVPGIAADDHVLIWSGGLYNWFDPQTLIRAVARLSERRDGVRLFFQGTKHPNPGVPEMAIVQQSRDLAKGLGALDRSVFFNDSWVDVRERHNYLIESDAGVSTHHAHIETTYSFRTRILDYLWAGLPMVVTEGDHFAELVEREGLGVVVPAEDVDALESALERVLFDEDFRRECASNIARVREEYRWDRVLRPLVEFVARPRHAQDLVERGVVSSGTGSPRRRTTRKRHGFRNDVRLAMHYLREGGPAVVASKIRRRVARRRAAG